MRPAPIYTERTRVAARTQRPRLLDDEALGLAARELGTITKKDTVNAALAFVANRRRRIEQLLDDPYALGVSPDITDPEIMRTARR